MAVPLLLFVVGQILHSLAGFGFARGVHSGMRPYTMVERTEGVRAAWPAAILTATFSLSTNTLLPLLEVKST